MTSGRSGRQPSGASRFRVNDLTLQTRLSAAIEIMKICDLHTGRNRLSKATKELRDQWQETKEVWHDANARDFAKEHLEPLGPQITLMLTAINRLREVLEKAERECSDVQT